MRWLNVSLWGMVFVPALTVRAQAERPGVISINLTGRLSSFNTPVYLHVEFGDSSAGVAGVNGNDFWNDVVVFGDQGTRSGTMGPWHVYGKTGEEAAITSRSQGTWSKSTQGTRVVPFEDPSGDLMDGWICSGTSQGAVVTVTGLADDFPEYDVYAYIGGSVAGKPGTVLLNGQSPVNFTTRIFDGTFVEGDGSNAADYVVYRGVTGDSFVLSTDRFGGTGIHGLEIVGAPEPSTLALLVVGCVGSLAWGWRRRRGESA